MAARLSCRGYKTEIFEKLSQCGGRNNILVDSGFKFDMGPSFVLMPDFFEEAFSYCGQDIKKYLDLKALDTSYKIFYPDNDTLSVYRQMGKTKDELEKIEKNSSKGYDKYIKEVTLIYNAIKPLLYRSFTQKSAFNPAYLPLLAKIRLGMSYWDLARKFFKSEKLCYAFTFESMFIGVSPFIAPAFYSVISYADHVQKIFHPMGGMYSIPLALEKMAAKFRTEFHYNNEVKKITRFKDKFVVRTDKIEDEFDNVVINADYPYAQTELFCRRIRRYKYSCSVYLLYLGLKRKVAGACHHNLFFAGDLRKNLKRIFSENEISPDSSFYVHVPTATDQSLAPEGKEIFYILVPVPNLEANKTDNGEYERKLKEVVFSRIDQAFGIRLKNLIEVEHAFYPDDFIKRYNIKYGATFGLAHNLWQSAFWRRNVCTERSNALHLSRKLV